MADRSQWARQRIGLLVRTVVEASRALEADLALRLITLVTDPIMFHRYADHCVPAHAPRENPFSGQWSKRHSSWRTHRSLNHL